MLFTVTVADCQIMKGKLHNSTVPSTVPAVSQSSELDAVGQQVVPVYVHSCNNIVSVHKLVSECLLHLTVAHVYRITFKQRNCSTVTVKQDKITGSEKRERTMKFRLLKSYRYLTVGN